MVIVIIGSFRLLLLLLLSPAGGGVVEAKERSQKFTSATRRTKEFFGSDTTNDSVLVSYPIFVLSVDHPTTRVH